MKYEIIDGKVMAVSTIVVSDPVYSSSIEANIENMGQQIKALRLRIEEEKRNLEIVKELENNI